MGGEAGRCLLPIGVILRILDWAAMRGGYEVCIVFDGCLDCGRMGPVVEAAVSLDMAPFCL